VIFTPTAEEEPVCVLGGTRFGEVIFLVHTEPIGDVLLLVVAQSTLQMRVGPRM
jgi:hypothetical protein